ncbi:MAG: hypothetical protein PHS52_07040 [Desulfotomaculaceae bacterium]|nr:hypothetical protein [Desulfotomaculaceae bacterium]
MVQQFIISGDVVLTFLGENIPVIGPRFKSRCHALKVARDCMEEINNLTGGARETPVQIILKRQSNGRYSLAIEGLCKMLGELGNLDELFLKRFYNGLKKKLFIWTCFVEEAEDMECLVVTEGLGAVFYAPTLTNSRRS